MANGERGSFLFRVTRGRLGKAPVVSQTQSEVAQPAIQTLTLQAPTREEGVALQREHGMSPIYEFHPTEPAARAVARREATPPDLSTPEGVAAYMAGSGSSQDWNTRTDLVRTANGGNYPSFWYQSVVLSGLASETSSRWGQEDK